MLLVGLLREGKIPVDNRVALSPQQCKQVQEKFGVKILVEQSPFRCFSDNEYRNLGIEVVEDISNCQMLFGIKEVPIHLLIPNKTYLFFSHTKKMQSHNKGLLQNIVDKNIRLIDYECLEHSDGQRIIGFGFFAGVVGAHNGIWAYGKRTGLFQLPRVYSCKDYRALIRHYFGLKLPNIKIAVTGSGRVAQGVIDVMHMLDVIEVEHEEYLSKKFDYPVYVQLKGESLYTHKELHTYKREHFHAHPTEYKSLFKPYLSCTNILMNGVFWDKDLPKLFEKEDINDKFKIQTIADITDDTNGSVPINLGDQTIENPVYGVDRNTFEKIEPYSPNGIDVIAVGNLPNELSRDASSYFGEQLIKFVLKDLFGGESELIRKATISEKGEVTKRFGYLADWIAS